MYNQEWIVSANELRTARVVKSI